MRVGIQSFIGWEASHLYIHLYSHFWEGGTKWTHSSPLSNFKRLRVECLSKPSSYYSIISVQQVKCRREKRFSGIDLKNFASHITSIISVKCLLERIAIVHRSFTLNWVANLLSWIVLDLIDQPVHRSFTLYWMDLFYLINVIRSGNAWWREGERCAGERTLIGGPWIACIFHQWKWPRGGECWCNLILFLQPFRSGKLSIRRRVLARYRSLRLLGPRWGLVRCPLFIS